MSGPPRDEPPQSAGEFFRGLLAAGEDRTRQLDAVDAAVRAQAEGKERDELRACFEAELDAHGLPRDPLWVERRVEEIEASPLDRVREIGKGIALAITTLPRLLARAGDGRDPPLPAWMQNPPEASFPGWAPGAVGVPVRIGEGVAGLLERALREGPQRVGHEVAIFDVWFERSAGGGPIEVRLGAELLGDLNPAAPPHGLAGRIQAAEEHGLKARASATLARARHLEPPYLLVVDVAPAEAPPFPAPPS